MTAIRHLQRGYAMDGFQRLAAFTIARDTAFVALAAATLMVGFSFAPLLAFKIGATLALINAVALMLRAGRLTDETVARSEPWKVLTVHERPAGAPGRHVACRHLRETMLRYAKASAGLSIALSSVAFAGSLVA
jgi:hypothetical protein